MKQQTAVDYLVEQFDKYYAIHQLDEEIEQAKQMEKEQTKAAYERAIANYGMPPLETKNK